MSASADVERAQAALGLECAWASSGDDSPLWRAVAVSPSGDVVATVGQVLRPGRPTQGPVQLVEAAKALVGEGHPPDEVVWSLRRLADRTATRARFLLAVFRLGDGRLDVHSGGHRAPLVAGPSGLAPLALHPSALLGDADATAPRWATTAIGPGDTVVLTSGLADPAADVSLHASLALRRSQPLVRVCQAAARVWPGSGKGGTILAVRVTDQL